jgi:ABC-type uncharacterized transport system substrate-binding protein
MRSWRKIGCAATMAVLPCLCFDQAAAHPHVFVVSKSEVLFDKAGKVRAIRHFWTFDEMYSSFAAQGIGTDGKPATREQFAPLAKENASSLAAMGYFTVVKIGGKPVEFGEVTDYWMEETPEHLVTFHVELPLKSPAAPGKIMSLQVYDPEYYISFEFDAKAPPALIDAPKGCSISSSKPDELKGDEKAKLTESFFSGLSPGAGFGLKMASRAIVACP